MSVVIQATTIGGKIIDNARWGEVEGQVGFREGQEMSLGIPAKDGALIGWLSRGPEAPNGCVLDGQKGNWSVIVACKIVRIRHMVETKSKQVDSMVVVEPVNRTAEQVMLYVLNPQKCDPRFVRAIRESFTQAPA